MKKDDEDTAIGERSSVRISLVIGLLSVCAGGFGLWIWWAATISAKLDNIIIQQTAQAQMQTKQAGDVEELKAWRKLVDSIGTTPVQNLNERVRLMEKEFELHRVTTGMKP